MKFIVSVLLTALAGYAAGLYLPWWSLAIAAFVVALVVHQTGGKAFGAGFLGCFLLWGILALLRDSANEHILSGKIANLLPLGGNVNLLLFATATIGGLVGGMAALCGSLGRRLTSSSQEVAVDGQV
jgi:hypothetical protein